MCIGCSGSNRSEFYLCRATDVAETDVDLGYIPSYGAYVVMIGRA